MLSAIVLMISLMLAIGTATADPLDDVLLERIKTLELQARTSEAENIAELEKIFSSLDRKSMPRSWVRAYSILLSLSNR